MVLNARSWLTIFALTFTPLQAVSAFEVFPFESGGQTLFMKWGDKHAGSPGGTVYWSLIPPGTAGDAAYCGDACVGHSGATLPVEIAPGGGFSDRSLESLSGEIETALARWSVPTGIEFVRIIESGALAINDPGAKPPITGDIRIGVFAFTSGGGAVGFAPPPNGGSGAGDVLFDANSFFQMAPGSEGQPFDTTFAPNDFESLLLHELGHAIGLAHPAFDGTCPVMQIADPCLGHINRELDPDDRAGAVFLYQPLFADRFELTAGRERQVNP